MFLDYLCVGVGCRRALTRMPEFWELFSLQYMCLNCVSILLVLSCTQERWEKSPFLLLLQMITQRDCWIANASHSNLVISGRSLSPSYASDTISTPSWCNFKPLLSVIMINFRKQAGLICQHHSLLILVLPFVSAISDQVRLALAILTRHVLYHYVL